MCCRDLTGGGPRLTMFHLALLKVLHGKPAWPASNADFSASSLSSMNGWSFVRSTSPSPSLSKLYTSS